MKKTNQEKRALFMALCEKEGYELNHWNKNGAERFYFKTGRRDCKVFVEFDSEYLGSELKIWIDDCGQHPNWYKGQREKLQDEFETAKEIAIAVTHCDYELPITSYGKETNDAFTGYCEKYLSAG